MLLRFLVIIVFCLGFSSVAVSVPVAGDSGDAAMPTVWGIPFEQVEASWEGGLKSWTCLVKGRLPGAETLATYEHRMRLGPDGWESTGELTLPSSRLAEAGALLGRFPGLADVTGSGTVGLTARVTGTGKEKRWEGVLHLEDVDLFHPAYGVSVEGLGGTFTWVYAEGGFTSAPEQLLCFDSIGWEEVVARNGEIEFGLISPEHWQLDRLVLDWAGGQLAAADVVVNPKAPNVAVRLGATGIRLEELLKLAPELQAQGEGTIDGQLSLRVRPDGLGLEPGHLALRPGSSATLHLPRRAWLTNEMSPDHPRYEKLLLVERALEDLELKKFRLEILSSRAPEVPLLLTIEGQPLAEGVPVPAIGLTLKIYGPIEELGNWALDPGVGVRVGLR